MRNYKILGIVLFYFSRSELIVAYKTEWLTIKNGMLYAGGYGKEWTDENGEEDPLIGRNPLHVKIINRYGRVRHVNWRKKFIALRKAVGIGENVADGYLIHESAQWSIIHKKWFFLPRKVSFKRYDDQADQKRGGNILIIADAKFKKIKVITINSDGRAQNLQDKSRGFSSFQFIPETNDEVIVALKTVEVENQPLESYITVFNIDGTVYIFEQKLTGAFKYEGIEFLNWEHAYWNQPEQI